MLCRWDVVGNNCTTEPVAYPDTVAGITNESCILGKGEEDVCLLVPYTPSRAMKSGRLLACRAYDFLSLL
jgi:hypothetical protein